MSILAIPTYAVPIRVLPEPEPDLDGFAATLRAMEALGLDLRRVPHGLLHMIYNSGVAFAEQSQMSESERQAWRNSINFPLKNQRVKEAVEVHVKLRKKL
jgi:hypothetical protein